MLPAASEPAVVEVGRRFAELGFTIKATEGTRRCLADAGIESEPIAKLQEGRPNIVDALTDGEIQNLVNLKFIASQNDYNVFEVMAMRDQGTDFVSLARDVREAKELWLAQQKSRKDNVANAGF